MFVNRPLILLISGVLCAWLPAKAQNAGSEPSAERWSVHFQATSIGQHHGSFPSLYEGENRLPAHRGATLAPSQPRSRIGRLKPAPPRHAPMNGIMAA